MAGSTWSNPAITLSLFNVVRDGHAVVSRCGNVPTANSSHRSRHSRRSHPTCSRGIRDSRRNHGNRRNRAMQLAHRCQHFPCRRGGMSPSSHRRSPLHPASPHETTKNSISAERPQPVQPMLKRRLQAKKSNPRHLRPALWPSPHSSASKPASPVTL